MKENVSPDAQGTEQNGSPAARDPHERKTPVEESQKSQDLREIRDIVSRYIGQLVDGCGSPTCTETLCDTGRHNNSQKPIRKYTPRSARAIAITLASGPKPQSHLCPQYNSKTTRRNSEAGSSSLDPKEPHRDPSAFVQQLSDSPSIRTICSPLGIPSYEESSHTTSTAPRNEELLKQLQHWHDELDRLSLTYYSSPSTSLGDVLSENERIADCLFRCIQWLVSILPPATPLQWSHVAEYVSAGNAFPAANGNARDDDKRNVWLRILDALERGPAFRLFSRVVALVLKRTAIEAFLLLPHDSEGTLGELKAESWRLPLILAERICYPVMGGTREFSEIAPVILWLEKTFLQYWDGEMSVGKESTTSAALIILEGVYGCMGRSGMELDIFEKPLAFSAVSQQLDAVKLAENYLALDEVQRPAHLLNFNSIFTTEQKALYFRTINHLRMRKAHSDAEKAQTLRSRSGQRASEMVPEDQLEYLETHYLLLNVSRGNVLQDAFDQLWQRRSGELLRPLRVRLGEMDEFEIGHDLGGVQIEFFNLVCRELFREDLQMFTTDPSTGLSYFRPGSLQPLYMFELCGMLFALALYNGITLPVSFPDAFYCRLFGYRNEGPDSIQDGWPRISKSLKDILKEDIPGLDTSLPLEANGLRLTVAPDKPGPQHEDGQKVMVVFDVAPVVHHEEPINKVEMPPVAQSQGTTSTEARLAETENILESIKHSWPGWHIVKSSEEPDEIASTNKAQYVQSYIDWLTFNSIFPQWTSFKKGFSTCIPPSTLLTLNPRTLRSILEGETHLDIDALRTATLYDGYDSKSKYIQHFWRIVASWPESKQKLLVKFVTATERMPTGGAGNLTFKVSRVEPLNAETLPSSSTCFGMLLLPRYASPEVLERKLGVAVEFGAEGFGTG